MTEGTRGEQISGQHGGPPPVQLDPGFGQTDERAVRSRSGPSRGVVLGLVAALVLALAAGAGAYYWWRVRMPPIEDVPPPSAAVPARTWPSGVWTGGRWGADRVAAFAAWRGSPAQTAVTYPAYDTWEQLAEESDWHVSVFDGFDGTLVYGLPLLPKDSAGRGLDRVAAGEHDDVFGAVADTLARHRRGDSYVRIGLEANGDWFPWGAGNGENSAESFKAAYRHVAQLLRAKLPQAKLVFDISAGAPLRGQSDRMGPLTELYPGDDVVDVIGVDHYDHYQLIAPNHERFERALRPGRAAGLQDVVDFARAHGKQFAVPEWGLTARDKDGGGDNPYFVYAMYRWFAAHAADLAFENYFNEPDDYLGSSIWDQVQNPKASAEYRALWGPHGGSSGASSGPSGAVSPSGSQTAGG